MSDLPDSVSIVLPVLNEEKTLPQVLAKAKQLKETVLKNLDVEILVSDNGSSDRSVEIARGEGVKVVDSQEKGYGAALARGIEESRNEIVLFLDADNSYDLLEADRLLNEVRQGRDLVIGSRFKGHIHRHSMPPAHQFLGTPFLTWLINCFYSNGSGMITDCNSGFRCLRRSAFKSWQIKSQGMEFASEMIIKAMLQGARISEVPVTLHPHSKGRAPHLKTWRDGMRHLLQIFLEVPLFFFWLGSGIWSVSWFLILGMLILKHPVQVGFASIFGMHTGILGLLGTVIGLTIWSIGLYLAAKSRRFFFLYSPLIQGREDRLFWSLSGFVLFSILLFAVLMNIWAANQFLFLHLEEPLLAICALLTNGFLFLCAVFTAHLIKR